VCLTSRGELMYTVLMPQLGLTMTEGTVGEWIKKEGDNVNIGDTLVEITTDKLTSEIVSEYEGTLLKIQALEGDEVPVRGVLCVIGRPEDIIIEEITHTSENKFGPLSLKKMSPENNSIVEDRRIHISPLARKTAIELGVNYNDLVGTGTSGRITQRDILAAENPEHPNVSTKDDDFMTGDTVNNLSNVRKIIEKRMLLSHHEIPLVTQVTKVDITELIELRKAITEQTGIKFSINDFILKASAISLLQHPEMRVSYYNGSVIHRAHVNIGMAVAIDDGLIVPVIKDADRMSVLQISKIAKDIAMRAKNNSLSPNDCEDSTFTITNLGMFGVESFTPLINQPDAAILGITCVQDEIVMTEDGTITKRQVMRFCLSYDHRLLDGAVAAKFVMDLGEILHKPFQLLL